jgi:hypothetical protein
MRCRTTFIILAAGFALLSCKQNEDLRAQGKLAGTWLFHTNTTQGVDLTYTITVAPDGSFVCRQAQTVGQESTNYTLEGVYRVKDGVVIETVTKHSHPGYVVPSVVRGRLIKLDAHEWVVQNETNKEQQSVMRRVEK